MGNANSAIDFEYKISANDYKPVDKIKDSRFGELIQMKNQTTEHVVMMREKIIKDSDSYKKAIEEHVNHMALRHKNLGRVHGFAGADSQEKNKARIYIYFDYLPDTLHSDINAKKLLVAQKGSATKNSNNYFPEASLFKIAADIIDVLEYLQQNSISHGDIKPDSCFRNKSGSIKIMDRKLVGDGTSAFELVKEGNRSFFLTPKAFECIKKGLNEPMEDKYRADVFSLGLTILECATLKPSSQIYDWNNYTINLTLLSNRLIEVKDRYSASFYNLVKGMVRLDEGQRPDFITLKTNLAEDGWINAYATSSPNFTEEDNVPELSSQVLSTNTAEIQTKGFRDSQLTALVSPTNKNSLSLIGNKTFSNNIFSREKSPSIHKPSPGIRQLQTEHSTEDVLTTDRIYNVNKVPQAIGNRSGGTPKGLISQSVSTSLQEMVLSRNQVDRSRESVSSNNIGGHYMNDKFKNKFLKVQGSFSRTSAARQVPQQQVQSPQVSQSSVKVNKTKAIFSDKPEFSKNAPSSTLPDHSVESEASSIMTYQYNYESAPAKKEFCVENLLQEVFQRSAKHSNFELLNKSKSDKPSHAGSRILDSVSRRPSQKPLGGVSPFGKSKLTINCEFNSNNEQSIRENITPFTIPSPKISFKEDDCNSEVTYFAPGVQGKPDAFISNQNSFLEFDSLRPSHRPIVVDVVDNSYEINKFLIDSIVKPEASNKSYGNIGRSPFGKEKNQIFQVQRDQTVYKAVPNVQMQAPINYNNSQPKQNAKSFAKDVSKNGKVGLDTSLEEDLDPIQKEVYTYSKAISTKEEFAPQEGGSNQFNANKFAEEPLDELIEKAIERSRQTYLMTTGGLNGDYKNAAPYSNASESKFSDFLASNNGMNNEQLQPDYENKFAPVSQIES